MPLTVSRLRRWFAVGAVSVVMVVTGTYFYAKHRVQNALKQVPEKIGLEIQQSAQGFTVSRSEQGRTLFKIQASKAVQFKQGGRAELHDVAITLYGRDSNRFDQIYGSVFEYDPQSGDVTAKGEVQIDLEANPEGLAKPDQAPPKELKNPVHLKTSGLVFNQKTGDAYTKERVEFSIPQAAGSAMGVTYTAKNNVLTLQSQVNIVLAGSAPATVTAVRGTITKTPRAVVLDHPHLQNGSRRLEADQGTLFLRPDNTMERVLATGNVQVTAGGSQPAQARARELELLLVGNPGTLHTATLSGDVLMEFSGPQPIHGNADRVIFNFSGKSVLTTVRTEGNVKLLQTQKPATASAGAQDLELTAPVVDFFLASGRHLQRAETSGAAQIAIRGAPPGQVQKTGQKTGQQAGQQTLVTAGEFRAKFDSLGQLTSVHGAPDARIVSNNPGQPDRVSTSNTLDVAFRTGSGIESILQQGSVAYSDGNRKAWAERARYTPGEQMLTLTGSPRVAEGGMTSTARIIRMNRSTGEAFAEADVKTTYSDLKAQPGGALLASSSPIHVTSRSMAVHGTPGIALYTGDARLWQDANIVEAPSLEFDRDHRSVVAHGSPTQSVSTVLVQSDKSGKATPVAVTSTRLTYTDNERKAHFEGGVLAKGADLAISAGQLDVFLQARVEAAANKSVAGTGTGPGGGTGAGTGRIERIVAQDHVVITQPDRRATGDQLVYIAAEDKFVLTGGPPSIFDAEHGKITGVSLTFFRHDDRVLVEGNDTSPTVTHTRVAR